MNVQKLSEIFTADLLYADARMQFLSTIALFATIGAVVAMPNGGSGSQCTTEQANKCCTGLTDGLLNLNVLSALCVRKSSASVVYAHD